MSLTIKGIEGYTVVGRLGDPEEQNLYLVKDNATGKLLVFKKIGPEDEEKNHHEVKISMAVKGKSPFVFSVTGPVVFGDIVYLSMPFSKDGDLHGFFKKFSENKEIIPLAQAIYIARSLLKGLQTLHTMGVLHRDIKPENIFFQNGKWVFADFGGSSQTVSGIFIGDRDHMGTLDYLPVLFSPWDEDAVWTQSLDIYSLGLIFFWLFSSFPVHTLGTKVIQNFIKTEEFGCVSAKLVERKKVFTTPPKPIMKLIHGMFQWESNSLSTEECLKKLQCVSPSVPVVTARSTTSEVLDENKGVDESKDESVAATPVVVAVAAAPAVAAVPAVVAAPVVVAVAAAPVTPSVGVTSTAPVVSDVGSSSNTT